MAYDSNSLNLQFPRVGSAEGGANAGLSAAQFVYRSADPIATVIGAGYFSDGADKGMQLNDYVIVIDDNVPTLDIMLVTTISAAGAATVTNLT